MYPYQRQTRSHRRGEGSLQGGDGVKKDFAAGENEAEGIRKKPAPDTVLKVLKVFNADKSIAVYVGDSEVDIMTAQNSGIPCISVSWGFKNKPFLVEHGAEFIADTPEDIIYYLQNK